MSAIDTLYGLYRRTPVPFQNLMVTGYGWILHRRRTGAIRDETLRFLLESRNWSRSRLEEYQLAQLQKTLQLAARAVPHYRDLWSRIGFDPRDVKHVRDLEHLPILEKDELKAAPERFVSEEARDRKLFKGNTSGTTGKPVTTYKDHTCYQKVWAFQERQRLQYGIRGERPRVSIGVRPVVPMEQNRPPFWRHDAIENNYHFSNFHISEATLDAYVDAIAEIDPEEINAYPSGAYLVAAHALRRGETRIRPRAVITCAETLYAEQRRVMEEAFACPVADQYGAAEVVFWVGQCPQGTYHQSMEFGIMESVVGSTPVRGVPGDAVGTGFVNDCQLLIRYRLGDAVVLPAEARACACGWETETVDLVVGRIDDVLYTPDGRALGRLDVVMKKIEGAMEAQLVQDAYDHLTVNLVSDGQDPGGTEATLRQRLADLFGPEMKVDVRWVPSIARTSSGKFRYQLNKVGPPPTASRV